MRKTLKEKGITLIALVVTIVVLLILAGVSINLVIGQNGLINKAVDAKEKTEQAKVNEQTGMDNLYGEIESILNGNSGTVSINLRIEGEKSTTEPPLPDSTFSYVEGTIDTGYVIEDGDGNQFVWVPVDKNQKITLEVTSEKDITELKLYDPYGDTILNLSDSEVTTTYSNSNITPTINGMYIAHVTTEEGIVEETLTVKSLYAQDAWNDFVTSEEYAKIISVELTGKELSKEEFWSLLITQEMDTKSLESAIQSAGCNTLNQFLTVETVGQKKNFKDVEDYTQSVNNNGGFYVARYEAGATTRTTEDSSDAVETIISSNEKPVSKEDQTPYNHVTYYQSVGLAESMYSDKNYTSTLLTGAAWDRTLGWIYETKNKSAVQIVADSKDWGNYSDSEFSITKGQYSTDYGASYSSVSGTYKKAKDSSILLTTGAVTTRNVANNIFDFAGNVYEWTLQAFTSDSRVYRGGDYNGDFGPKYVVFGFHNCSPGYSGDFVGFRVALYL